MRVPRTLPAALSAAVLLVPGCAGAGAPAQAAADAGARGTWDAPPIARCTSVREGATGRQATLDELLDDLESAEVVFLGETHLDEATHRFELAVLEGLLARRPGEVVLSLEMFERDVQPLLDRYLAGEVDEAEFLAGSRPWGNYRTGYRPLVEAAKRAGAPVVAANFPAPLRRGLDADAGPWPEPVPADQRAFAPAELLPSDALYWKRVDNAIRGHAAAMGLPEPTPDARLLSTQSLWDNAMGEACALALERHAGSLVLHVVGGFHTAYGDGTARQLLLRRPGTRVRTVAIETAANPATAGIAGLSAGDWTAFVEARAADVSGDEKEVALQRTLQFRLHVPDGARDDAPLPLLVWLPEDGLESQDGLDLWVARLGSECLIASVDAPYRERQPDGSSGRRWFWRDTFAEDVGAACGALSRVLGYVGRHRAIDPERVVIAGDRAGATVAIAAALALDELPLRVVAWAPDPEGLRGLSDLPLPLLELRGDVPPRRTRLELMAWLGWAPAWEHEADSYQAVGLEVRVSEISHDPWERELRMENALREALALEPRTLLQDAPRFSVSDVNNARARQWARVAAWKRAPQAQVALWPGPLAGGFPPLQLEITPDDVRAGAELPRAPGSFGGTTILVLPAGMDAAAREAWIALEADDPIAAKNRFSRLRVATLEREGERSLESLLERQVEEGRRNVLLAPAVFHADDATLAELRARAEAFADRLDLAYRAGLGGL